MARRRLIELSAVEEAMLVWQDVAVPWNGQFAVTAPRLDPSRLGDAFAAALAHHPLTSCVIDSDERGRYWWVHDDDAEIGEIPVVDCPDVASVVRLRGHELDRPIDAARAPLMRAAIARGPDHDTLVASISHVLSDGLGMLRFLRSVGRAYRGEFDPPPAVDIAAAHAALQPHGAGWSALAKQWTAGLEVAASTLTERSRLACQGGAEAGGFGVMTRSVEASAVTAARRANDASFDEYLMAGLHLTIEHWNQRHGETSDCVGVSQAVNLRPAEWSDDVVVNVATFVSVLTDPADRRDLASALARVAPQLERDVRQERARAVANGARLARVAPRTLRRQALGATPPALFDTCVISNIGFVADPPRFADDHAPVLDAATPAMPHVGMTIGLQTDECDVRFLACYRTERFDEQGAADFLELFGQTLRGG